MRGVGMGSGWTVMLSAGEFFRPRRPPPEEPGEAKPPLVQFRDTSYIPPAQAKPSRRFLPGFLVALVGLAMLTASLSTPWYYYSISGRAWIGNVYYDVYDRSDYSFNGISTVEEKSVPGFTVAKTTPESWPEYDKRFTDAHRSAPKLSGVYSSTMIILIAAVTLCGLGALLSAVFRLKKKPPLFPAVVLVAGAIVALCGVAAFSAGHQPALADDRSELHIPTYPAIPPSGPDDSFWGESSRAPLQFHWGPSAGWGLALAGPAMILAGATLLWAMNRGRER